MFDVGIPGTGGAQRQGPAYIRPELLLMLEAYDTIKDVIAGSRSVKRRKEKYLPRPNPLDVSKPATDRYRAYVLRAVFYAVAKRTLSGFLGAVFLRDPVIDIPPTLDFLKNDASGDGLTLIQVAYRIAYNVLPMGRAGILVDYPQMDAPVTIAQKQDGDIRPVIRVFAPYHVVNWRTIMDGAREVLTLVVIYEGFEVEDDGFEIKQAPQYRVLRLVNGVYTVFLYTKTDGQYTWSMTQTYEPKGPDGKSMDFIPFTFVGAIDNNASVDDPPFEPIVDVNIGHYRNSADYEESVFLVGQPTPVATGLTQIWVDENFKQGIALGSRTTIPLPTGATFELVQATPNTLAKDAMDTKERQMVALGAKLVEQRQVQRTATEAGMEDSASNSVLSSIAKNISAAMEQAIRWCAFFENIEVPDDPEKDGAIKCELTSEFDLAQMGATERAQVIKDWQSGAITFGEMRAVLRRAGIATVDDDQAAEEIAAETTASMANVVNPTLFDMPTPPNAPQNQPPQNQPPGNKPPSNVAPGTPTNDVTPPTKKKK